MPKPSLVVVGTETLEHPVYEIHVLLRHGYKFALLDRALAADPPVGLLTALVAVDGPPVCDQFDQRSDQRIAFVFVSEREKRSVRSCHLKRASAEQEMSL